jgi:hypothetical protein
MSVERPEATGEVGMLPRIQMLIAEENHLVLHDRSPDCVTRGVGQSLAQVDTFDLGADCGLQLSDRQRAGRCEGRGRNHVHDDVFSRDQQRYCFAADCLSDEYSNHDQCPLKRSIWRE